MIEWGGTQKFASATRQELLLKKLVNLDLASKKMIKELAESGVMERPILVGRASPKAIDKIVKTGLASEPVKKQCERNNNDRSEDKNKIIIVI